MRTTFSKQRNPCERAGRRALTIDICVPRLRGSSAGRDAAAPRRAMAMGHLARLRLIKRRSGTTAAGRDPVARADGGRRGRRHLAVGDVDEAVPSMSTDETLPRPRADDQGRCRAALLRAAGAAADAVQAFGAVQPRGARGIPAPRRACIDARSIDARPGEPAGVHATPHVEPGSCSTPDRRPEHLGTTVHHPRHRDPRPPATRPPVQQARRAARPIARDLFDDES